MCACIRNVRLIDARAAACPGCANVSLFFAAAELAEVITPTLQLFVRRVTEIWKNNNEKSRSSCFVRVNAEFSFVVVRVK